MISEEIQRMGGREQATVFNNDLREAIIENGNRWGSNKDYVADLIERARKDPGLFYFGQSDAGKRIAWIPPVGSPSTTPTPRLTIPVECWKPIGANDPHHRLLAQVIVNGYDFHAEAYEVIHDSVDTMKVLEEGYDELIEDIAPGQCMRCLPINIGGQERRYLIVISPHCH